MLWNVRLTALAAMMLLGSGCSSSGSGQVSSGAPSTGPTRPPVQSGREPNAPGQTPAFPEQTRAPGLADEVALTTTVLAEDLAGPWGMAFLPGGDFLVSEKTGDLRVITAAGDKSEPIEGVPEVDNRDQGGLLDVVLAPDFDTSRWVYLSYSEPRADGKNGTSVARGRLSEDRRNLENVEVLLRQVPAWESTKHYGSRLVFDREGRLYITTGERSLPEPRQLAQDLDALLGKVLRINADGGIPADNPFVNRDGRDEIWSYGHRNIQGADLHPDTGELWVIEHGPRGGDELNKPLPGGNYGWPLVTYGEDYSGAPIGAGLTQREGIEQPVYYWDPVIAPGDMVFYQGAMFPEWHGQILVASLKPGGVVRLELEDERVTGEAVMLEQLGRVRDVDVGEDGALYLLTDGEGGRLIKATRDGS